MVTPLDLTAPGVATRLIQRYGVTATLYPKRVPSSSGETGADPQPQAVVKAVRAGSANRGGSQESGFKLSGSVTETLEGDEGFIVDGAVVPQVSGEIRLASSVVGDRRFRILEVIAYSSGELIAAYKIIGQAVED